MNISVVMRLSSLWFGVLLAVACGAPEGSAPPENKAGEASGGAAGTAQAGGSGGQGGVAGMQTGGQAGSTIQSGGQAGSAGAAPEVCSVSDPRRVFFNDFETGEVFGDDAATQFFHRAGYSDASNYAVLEGALMGGRAGKVLRGNMWQWIDGEQGKGQAYDPLAKAQGIEIKGTKTPAISVALDKLGIVQVPSADATAQTMDRAEVYVSLWFWMDADFTYKALSNGAQQEQSVKLFYAFGTNNTQWVQTTQSGYNTFFLNVNELGGWLKEDGSQSGPKLEGAWHHLEFAFRSESKPVYYEYGSFSQHPELLASGCAGVKDYSIAFPVIGSSPQSCLSNSEALAQNSQDGRYQMRIDGQPVLDLKQVPFNARFSGFNFPAWHGGGGQAVGNAGWAMDDYCVRDQIPEGMLD